MEQIAFFGLGTMGVPIIKNLLQAGYDVAATVHNGHRQGPDAVLPYGARIVDTVQEAVKNALLPIDFKSYGVMIGASDLFMYNTP